MTADFVTRTKCRLCSGERLQRVIELEATPPANELCRSVEAALAQQRFPLDLHFCEDCAHLQLLTVVSPERLFSDYVYVSGTSPVFRAHFSEYAQSVVDGFGAAAGELVVEIGSNDGTLLGAFAEKGLRVLGIDPALKIAREASERGLPTIADFFTPRLAGEIAETHGQAKVVVANNVLAHIDDLSAVVRGVETLLADDGVFVMEVSYLLDVISKVLFDTIYHEHLDYHALGPLLPFFEAHGLRVVDAERVASHGGSIRVFAQRAGAAREGTERLGALLAEEEQAGLYRADTYRAFNARIARLGEELNALLRDMLASGKRIAAFGLPAKAKTAHIPWATYTDPELAQVGLTEAPPSACRRRPLRSCTSSASTTRSSSTWSTTTP